jgi:hypothetical protein
MNRDDKPSVMTLLQAWRNADHEDAITLTRHEVITLIEEHRTALDALARLEDAEAAHEQGSGKEA